VSFSALHVYAAAQQGEYFGSYRIYRTTHIGQRPMETGLE